ncbi:MAG: MGMT family protein [Candidatus Enteromonas sp.]|nr:MGMT family protein [Candidatus Enteromonas sp.]
MSKGKGGPSDSVWYHEIGHFLAQHELTGEIASISVEQYKVYDFLTTIPKGKVVTYGQIAEFLGNKKLARVVGNILHSNPDEKKYPCYKVVDSQGRLSKHFAFGGIEGQKRRLEGDGIAVIDYKVDLDLYQVK